MKIFYTSLLFIFLLSCDGVVDNENQQSFSCSNLNVGLIDKNSDIVNTEVNKLTIDLEPTISDSDKFGHIKNINLLVERLNLRCNNITAELLCYACIKTNPLQSEIQITFDSSGSSIKRIIDISTPEDAVLKCLNIH